jgi:hypothetical protein
MRNFNEERKYQDRMEHGDSKYIILFIIIYRILSFEFQRSNK